MICGNEWIDPERWKGWPNKGPDCSEFCCGVVLLKMGSVGRLERKRGSWKWRRRPGPGGDRKGVSEEVEVNVGWKRWPGPGRHEAM